MDNSNLRIEKQWNYRGYECLVLIMPMGHRCGYVGVPSNHALYDNDEYPDVEVHGGITFGGFHRDVNPALYWYGFDCGHSMDRPDPALVMEPYRSILELTRGGTIRTLNYCIEQCNSMVDQIYEKYGEVFVPAKLDDELFSLT